MERRFYFELKRPLLAQSGHWPKQRSAKSATTGLMHRSEWRSYSITRPAIVSRAGGISIARALAVLRLITSCNFVGRDGWTVDRVFGIFPRLAELHHHCGAQLSGGERGMFSVGRALMIDPQLILMGEPSEGLAPVMVQHLQELILDLKREGLSIQLIEQNLYSALAVGDRVYVLESGQVVHQGAAKELTQHTELLFLHLDVQ
jgi:ABC-type branched-subunit amino acid transport system ATPase component